MLKKIFIISIILTSTILSQVEYKKIFEQNVNEFSIQPRITQSGIFCISSFDLQNDTILLNSFDNKTSEIFFQNKLIKTKPSKLENLLSENSDEILKEIKSENLSVSLKKSFIDDNENVFLDDGGIIKNPNGEEINVLVENRNSLVLNFKLNTFVKTINFSFPNNLACADFIGIDNRKNIFILIEKYISDIPLKIKREVYVISSLGEILSILEIPSVKYFLTLRDFQIDSEGNLYHLISEKDKITIFKWSGLNKNNKGEKFQYPNDYNYTFHFNEITPIDEAEVEAPKNVTQPMVVSRTDALEIGEKYVYLKYYCNSNNLAPTPIQAPDGDYVQTPSWLVVGYNATVPYMWGGFSSISQFLSGLSSGKYAGDIHTSGVTSYSVGVDCSGFVSRCWQTPFKYGTSGMFGITTEYSSWDSLKPGDAILKEGHVRMFIKKNPNGTLKTVEAASRHWNVSYWSFSLSDLTTYSPRYYNSMESNYSTKYPTIVKAIGQSINQVNLEWTCDTDGVKGYRLYKSTDGENFSLLLNENTLTTTSVTITKTNAVEYYRVSSVLNDGNNTESDWSNIFGVGYFSSTKKILIVDGFERSTGTGSFQGPYHNFILRYCKAIKDKSIKFDCVRNSLVINSQVNLNDYDAVFWVLGDESTTEETFNSTEQTKVKTYLEAGGNLFVSGSEIGWDLYASGSSTASDKSFYNNYLKANYVSDNASSNSAAGATGGIFDGISFYFGQTYEEDYPDEIGTYGGSTLCMKYGNNKGAGILYSGTFGSSSNIGKIIHFGFPLETTADDTKFNDVISNSCNFFFDPVSISTAKELISEFRLEQNYPNPFNPTTKIKYTIPSNVTSQNSNIVLKVYDMLGQEVQTLVNKEQSPGEYEVEFNADGLSSGIYLYKLKCDNFYEVKKMLLIK